MGKFADIKNKTEYFATKPAFVFIVCTVAFVFHAFAFDLAGIMTFAIAGGLCYIIFDDVRPALTFSFTAVFIVSTQNSPGYGNWSDYYFKPQILTPLIVSAAFLFLCMTVRCILRRKNFLTAKSLIPVAVFSFSMLLSGIGNVSENHYAESVLYALYAVLTYLGLYILFSGAVDRGEGLFDYAATLFSGICLLIAMEIFYVYILNSFQPFGFLPENWKQCMRGGVFTAGWKGLLITGWGVSNVAGEMTVMLLPFVFYKLLKTKEVAVYELIALLSMLAGVLSLSRNAVLFGGILFVGFMIYAFIKTDKKLVFGITFAAFIAAAVVVGIILAKNSSFFAIFKRFIDLITQKREFSTGREKLWAVAARYFGENPIFGGGFAKAFYDDAIAFEHAGGGNFFQTLFHNFIFQAAGSGGIVGLITLGYFAYRCVRVFCLGKYENKLYLVCFALAFAGMACFDIIYFIPHSAAFFVFALVIAEKSISKGKPQNNSKTEAE